MIGSKILLVDDEENILAGLKRQLRGTFNIETAVGGHNGLQVLQEKGPFAVIVSDMRMPEMNGIQFLVKSAKLYPDTVLMMLTGNADLETAMHAVNKITNDYENDERIRRDIEQIKQQLYV